MLIVALGFSLQHVAFSLTGWQDALARFLAMFLFGLALGPLYLKIKRLLPLIIAHWLLDLIFLGLFSLIAVLTIH